MTVSPLNDMWTDTLSTIYGTWRKSRISSCRIALFHQEGLSGLSITRTHCAMKGQSPQNLGRSWLLTNTFNQDHSTRAVVRQSIDARQNNPTHPTEITANEIDLILLLKEFNDQRTWESLHRKSPPANGTSARNLNEIINLLMEKPSTQIVSTQTSFLTADQLGRRICNTALSLMTPRDRLNWYQAQHHITAQHAHPFSPSH